LLAVNYIEPMLLGYQRCSIVPYLAVGNLGISIGTTRDGLDGLDGLDSREFPIPRRPRQVANDEAMKTFMAREFAQGTRDSRAYVSEVVGLPKFGSVRFFKDFAEPRTGLQVRFGKSAEL
jgi:hypothetical protein